MCTLLSVAVSETIFPIYFRWQRSNKINVHFEQTLARVEEWKGSLVITSDELLANLGFIVVLSVELNYENNNTNFVITIHSDTESSRWGGGVLIWRCNLEVYCTHAYRELFDSYLILIPILMNYPNGK